MDQDSNRAFRAAEDAGDLGRRHLVDEAQDDRAATIRRQPPDRAPRRRGLVVRCRGVLDVEGIGNERRGLDRSLWVTAAAAPLVGDDVSGDPEEPDAERGRTLAVRRAGAFLEPVEVRQRSEEGSFRGVLGFVVIAELIERVAVHLGQVPAIEGIELGGVPARILDQ